MKSPEETAAGSLAGTLDAPISFFPGVWGKTPIEAITIRDFLRHVSGGTWKKQVEACRALLAGGDEIGYREGKRSLPGVCLSATTGTRDASIEIDDRGIHHSGYLQGDLDEKDHRTLSLDEIEQRLRSLPEVGFYFRSPSGCGIKVGIRIPPSVADHEAAFISASALFADHDLKLDPATKDPLRLCFVSFDPNLWIRDDGAIEMEVVQSGQKVILGPWSENDPRYPKPSEDQVRDMLSFVPPRPHYPIWLKIISSVCDAVGEEAGIRLLKEWSPEEREGEYEEKVPHRLNRVTAATLVFYAREHGWTGGCQPADIQFFPQRGEYYIRDNDCWRPYRSRSHVINRLIKAQPDDLSPKEKRGRADSLLQSIEERNVIDWAGPLAGHAVGPHQAGQHKLLITVGPRLIEPKSGSWKTISAILEAVLGDDDHVGSKQVGYVLGWLKLALAAVRSGVRTPGHVLILAGVPESGKSLLVFIFQMVLGGRVAVPHQAWSRETTFNADLMGAELLVIDDCYNSGEMAKRRALATSMKESLFNDEVRIHPKGREAFCVRPVWRAMMCCNDDPDSLYVIPPLSGDVQDKFTILRTHRRPLDLFPSGPEQRSALQQQIRSEMAAFIHHLDTMTLPNWLKANNRCGIHPLHHPHIKSLLGDLNPEVQLLEIIDYVFGFHTSRESDQAASWDPIRLVRDESRAIWTAGELLDHLSLPGQLSPHMCKVLPSSPQRMGRYLTSLAKSHPHRVREATMRNGFNRWEIVPPSEPTDTNG